MNREYNCKVSSKNSKRLLKNLQKTTGDYFFCCTLYIYIYIYISIYHSLSITGPSLLCVRSSLWFSRSRIGWLLGWIQFSCFITEFVILNQTSQFFLIQCLLVRGYFPSHCIHNGGWRWYIRYIVAVSEIWQTTVRSCWCCMKLSCSNPIETFNNVFRCWALATASALYTLQSRFYDKQNNVLESQQRKRDIINANTEIQYTVKYSGFESCSSKCHNSNKYRQYHPQSLNTILIMVLCCHDRVQNATL